MSKSLMWLVLCSLLISTNCRNSRKPRSLFQRFTGNPLFEKFFNHHDDDYDVVYYDHLGDDDCDDSYHYYQPHEEYGPPPEHPHYPQVDVVDDFHRNPWTIATNDDLGESGGNSEIPTSGIQFLDDKVRDNQVTEKSPENVKVVDFDVPDFHRNPWPTAHNQQTTVTNEKPLEFVTANEVPDFHRNPWPITSVFQDSKPQEIIKIEGMDEYVPDFHRNPWPTVANEKPLEVVAANEIPNFHQNPWTISQVFQHSKPQEVIKIESMDESVPDFHRNPWPTHHQEIISFATLTNEKPLEIVTANEIPDFHRNPWPITNVFQDSKPQESIKIDSMDQYVPDFHRNPWPTHHEEIISAATLTNEKPLEIVTANEIPDFHRNPWPISQVQHSKPQEVIKIESMGESIPDFHRNQWAQSTITEAAPEIIQPMPSVAETFPDFHRNPWPVAVVPTSAVKSNQIENLVDFQAMPIAENNFHRNPWPQVNNFLVPITTESAPAIFVQPTADFHRLEEILEESREKTKIPSVPSVPDFHRNPLVNKQVIEGDDFHGNDIKKNSFVGIGTPTFDTYVEPTEQPRKHQMVQIPLEREVVMNMFHRPIVTPTLRVEKPQKNRGKPKKVRVKVFKKKLRADREPIGSNLEHNIQFLSPRQEKLLENADGDDVSEYFRGDFGQKLDLSGLPLDLEHIKGVPVAVDSYGNQLRFKRT